jgi:hypothetical protein
MPRYMLPLHLALRASPGSRLQAGHGLRRVPRIGRNKRNCVSSSKRGLLPPPLLWAGLFGPPPLVTLVTPIPVASMI